MNKLFAFIILTFLGLNVFAQNIGQAGDTLVNYTDINGFKQGVWKKNHTNGELKYEAYFVDDKPIGDYRRYNEYGNVLAHLIYEKDGETAKATIYHRTGSVAGTGKYYGKKKDSVWQYYDANKIQYLQESFKKGVKHGQFLQITSEGVVIEELNWVDGIKHGPWIKRFAEGPLMWEANYVNGILEGMTKTFYKNGNLHKEGKFVKDLMHGPWKIYNESGDLSKIHQYTNGYSPEAENEKNEMMEELERNKGQYDEPKNSNDLDWLRGKTGGY